MGVLAPLVKKAQPALFGSGVAGYATEGVSWEWAFVDVTDDAGTAIDLTTVTGTATIYTSSGGTVTTLTFTGAADGSFTLTLDESSTTGLAAGGGENGRLCRWALVLSDGTDVVQAWGPVNSRFTILPSVP